jgi:hypothetical protein
MGDRSRLPAKLRLEQGLSGVVSGTYAAFLEMVEKWKFHKVHFQLQTDFSLPKI